MPVPQVDVNAEFVFGGYTSHIKTVPPVKNDQIIGPDHPSAAELPDNHADQGAKAARTSNYRRYDP